jgi:hypothetical protein
MAIVVGHEPVAALYNQATKAGSAMYDVKRQEQSDPVRPDGPRWPAATA